MIGEDKKEHSDDEDEDEDEEEDDGEECSEEEDESNDEEDSEDPEDSHQEASPQAHHIEETKHGEVPQMMTPLQVHRNNLSHNGENSPYPV